MRTAQGEWIYMVNPEAVRIPGPQITVISPGIPLMYGYPYSLEITSCPQGVVPAPSQRMQQFPQPPQGMVLPPLMPSGQVYYYPAGAGGFVVQPHQ